MPKRDSSTSPADLEISLLDRLLDGPSPPVKKARKTTQAKPAPQATRQFSKADLEALPKEGVIELFLTLQTRLNELDEISQKYSGSWFTAPR